MTWRERDSFLNLETKKSMRGYGKEMGITGRPGIPLWKGKVTYLVQEDTQNIKTYHVGILWKKCCDRYVSPSRKVFQRVPKQG